jgi:alpha-tubulin suppressor-like RCC1 family protein
MAVTGSITTRFKDEKGLDLGKTLIEKDYLISVYPNLLNQFDTPALFGWGNNYGALGDNTSVFNRSSPVQTIAFGANWKQVSTGGAAYSNQTAAIKTDGTLWSWGYNAYGQLGDNTVALRSSPVQTIAFGTNWKQVACGHRHTAAIKTDGTLWTWGINTYGALGDNTRTHRSSPVQTVAFGANWKQVSCGESYTAAIKTDGTLWLWGYNYYGSLGDNTRTYRSSPVQTVAFGTNWKQVSCGRSTVGAIKTDGTLWLWGYNGYGVLGDNTTINRSSPSQTVAFGTNWKQVSGGYQNTAAIKTDGTLWCWGWNYYGSLGDNTSTSRSSPVQTITFATNWKSVNSSDSYTAAIKTDGTLWLWGRNSYGSLGDDTTNNRASPVQTFIGGNLWKSLASGSSPHTFAIKDGDF